MVYVLAGRLSVLVIALSLKIFSLKKSACEIADAFVERLQTDTNTLIDISSSDKDMCRLADSINKQLSILRKEHLQYHQGNTELKNAITNISHDIRTPLTAINGFTAMAKKYIDDPSRCMDCLNKIEKSEMQLQLLINQVLEMSRIESGKVILDEKPFDLTQGFHEVFEVLKDSAEEHGVSIKFEDNTKQNKVLADIARMNQLALNIIGNAIS